MVVVVVVVVVVAAPNTSLPWRAPPCVGRGRRILFSFSFYHQWRKPPRSNYSSIFRHLWGWAHRSAFQYSEILLRWCYSPTLLVNFLSSSLLRTKTEPTFKHFLNIHATLQDLPGTFQAFYLFSALLWRFPFNFSTCYHHWCHALRFAPHFPYSYILPSLIIDAMLQGVTFNFWASLMPCSDTCIGYSSALIHLWCYASRSSLQFSNIIAAVLSDFFFNFLTSLMRRSKTQPACKHSATIDATRQGSSLQNSNVLPPLMLRFTIFSTIVQHHFMLHFKDLLLKPHWRMHLGYLVG